MEISKRSRRLPAFISNLSDSKLKPLRIVAFGITVVLSQRIQAQTSPAPAQVLSQTAARQEWWAFRTPVKPAVPPLPGPNHWVNPIDAFLLEKLRSRGLDFAPQADDRTLIRRLSFDLTGLPPNPAHLDEPFDHALERLLASPQYGERWGRHWLDVVRFGETDGGEHNHERFNAWPYRDYVINALNRDLPYNQFVREQIAGDILDPMDRSRIAATGFLVSGPWDQVSAVLNKDPIMHLTARMDELDDIVTTTCATFLGLTVNCARCHNHKFDPIPTRDYYSVAAAFGGAGFGERRMASADEQARYDALVRPLRDSLGKIRSELSAIEDPVTARLLRAKYVAFDESRRADPRRIPVNPIYNRESFEPITAKYWRFVVNDTQDGKARIESIALLPGGATASHWVAESDASISKPAILTVNLTNPKPISEVIWSSDSVTGSRDGKPTIYRIEASVDGSTWRTVASNLDHVSKLELDLPGLDQPEIDRALGPEARTRRTELTRQQRTLESQIGSIPEPVRIYAVTTHKPDSISVLERGSVERPVEPANPGALSAVRQLPARFTLASNPGDSDRRLALADWIVDPRNPLTARVIVNRVWYYHFGSGIVNTPSDFGVNGDRPSHPELLDWLAVSFMEHGWSLKWLHRQILTSRAYRQSSKFNESANRIDAGNRLLWRMPLRRMDAETLRDSILAVTGSLNPKAGGPSFALHQMGSRGSYIYHALDNDGPEVWRRAVYRFVVRGGDKTLLDSFDCPDPSVATPQRSSSNTPVQALALLNNSFVVRQAGLFAARLIREAGPNIVAQVRLAYRLAFGRDASAEDMSRARKFLKSRPLTLYCRALLNANEFVYVP